MGLIYKHIIRPIFFKQDPERAHEYAVMGLKMLGQLGPVSKLMERYNQTSGDPVEIFGLKFPNRVGLAAGFDKNAECWHAAPTVGFGHVEIGTVTHLRQPGNQKPRLFRFPEEQAIINRMGFNNDGAEAIADRLTKSPVRKKFPIPLGINIGKSKAVPNDQAADDYLATFNLLADFADYFTINVSSPNTGGLRELQNKKYLPSLLSTICKANKDRAKKMGRKESPLLLKIAPDLRFKEIDSILETVQDLGISGIIATNTTLARPGAFADEDCPGGLSGPPLFPKALEVIKYISKATEGKLPIIGSGGIMDAETAGAAMDAGASLVQIYTGMIYEGPYLAKKIARALAWTQNSWV